MHPLPTPFSRRNFLRASALATAGTLLARPLAAAGGSSPPLFTGIGIAAPIAKAAELKAVGIDFLTEAVDQLLVPDKNEDAFAANLTSLASSSLPVLACNNFLRPRHLRCVGADANHDEVLAWADTTFARGRRAGARFIVFGSSGSRAIRDDWPRDRAEAQFRELLGRMGPLAERHGITVAVEQLRVQECNFINRIAEGADIIRAVGHPRVRLTADLFHMTVMKDTPADLKAAMDVIVHLEIAETEGRTPPGVQGQDFRPFFRVLREAGYQGLVNIEGSWKIEQLAAAVAEIRKQEREA